jgi:prefoldin subunit 5
MPTPQEEIIEVKSRLNSNIAKLQEIQAQIKKLQEEGQGLTQPIIEDQGALKVLEKLIGEPTT